MNRPRVGLAILASCLLVSPAVPGADPQDEASGDGKIDLVTIGYDLGTNTTALTMLQNMVKAVEERGAKGRMLVAGRDEKELDLAMKEAVDLASTRSPTRAEIVLETPVVEPGERIVCMHSEIPNASKQAWIGFFPVDAADDAYISYTFLNNLTKRVYDVAAPERPGEYQFRLFLGEKVPPEATSDTVEVLD
ncbi:MAG: hypothetical protein FJ221_02335 [Lentisphaerae bacterium]|nr:hypothetical protein [Lentisphaerota bacterium]